MSAASAPHVSPLPLLSAAEMRAWDGLAIHDAGVPERVLMENAGRAAARVIARLFPEGRVVAAVGGGNNGGDAVVALRCLRAWGRDVAALPLGEAELPAALLHGWDLPVVRNAAAGEVLRGTGVVVDGLLGTGATGALRDPVLALARQINASGAPVVALDGPTGVDLTTGAAEPDAVRAAVTVTFGAAKRGLLLYPGREHAGRVLVVDAGFPPLRRDERSAALITPEWARARLPSFPANAHKGSLGTVALVAGHPGMGGAAILAAMGALRAGAGKARVVSPRENRVAVQATVPEALFVDRDGEGCWDAIQDCDAVLAGPGMGTDDSAAGLLQRLLRESELPTLLDADALTLIARDPEMMPRHGTQRLLLTPHPGEMSRLLDRPIPTILEDPFAVAEEAASRFGCAVLLKGFPALVAAPGEPTLVNVAGHSGIATGGMGDTLGGIAAALLAMGASPRDAGALALFYAGRAAELAGRGRSLLPRDVAEALPQAFSDRSGFGTMAGEDVLLDLPPGY